jgi:hypothetical protein
MENHPMPPMVSTNFPHPDIKSGQHTNGPATVWIQVDGRWINTGSHSIAKVSREIYRFGVGRIVSGEWNEYLYY